MSSLFSRATPLLYQRTAIRVSRCHLSHTTQSFLARSPILSARASSTQGTKGPTPKRPVQEELPAFDLNILKGNKTVRAVVLIALTVFGTMETIFWAKVLWAKFGPAPEEDEAAAEGKSG